MPGLEIDHGAKGKGFTSVLVALMLTALLGFAVLAIDTSMLIATQAELQTAADHAALATAHLIAKIGRKSRQADRIEAAAAARDHGISFIHENNTIAGQPFEPVDVQTGWANWVGGRVQGFNESFIDYNAVEVSITIPHLSPILGAVLGHQFYRLSATALAVLSVDPRTAYLPFTVREEDWKNVGEPGPPDEWSWNEVELEPEEGGDGTAEVVMFPSGSSGQPCAGNSGALAINRDPDFSRGTPALIEQILSGLSDLDLESVFDTSEPVFDDGSSYSIEGSPGLRSAMREALESRIGDVVAVFLHDSCENSGSNATYNIVGIRFGRLMTLNFHGSPKNVVIQATNPQAVPSTFEVLGLTQIATD